MNSNWYGSRYSFGHRRGVRRRGGSQTFAESFYAYKPREEGRAFRRRLCERLEEVRLTVHWSDVPKSKRWTTFTIVCVELLWSRFKKSSSKSDGSAPLSAALASEKKQVKKSVETQGYRGETSATDPNGPVSYSRSGAPSRVPQDSYR
jgi:hypothetical protein